jgi:hypothetical protein
MIDCGVAVLQLPPIDAGTEGDMRVARFAYLCQRLGTRRFGELSPSMEISRNEKLGGRPAVS